MEARYRTDYAGEFIILELKWVAGKKEESREWIPNSIENRHLSGRAACIGSNVDRWRFDYKCLQRHRGGLLASKKLQTYGIGSIALDMRLDFVVETDTKILTKILETGYQQNNVVYTTARNCISSPGEFYLIPHKPRLFDEIIAVYLAAFDGHQEIFLLGYTDDTEIAAPNWQAQLTELFSAYSGVKFYLVGESTRMPDAWVECFNVRTMPYSEFISYCDV